jgi:hypothetical protein
MGARRHTREVNHLPANNADLKKTWVYNPVPPYAFMAQCSTGVAKTAPDFLACSQVRSNRILSAIRPFTEQILLLRLHISRWRVHLDVRVTSHRLQ